jgi:hypothetical protein
MCVHPRHKYTVGPIGIMLLDKYMNGAQYQEAYSLTLLVRRDRFVCGQMRESGAECPRFHPLSSENLRSRWFA